MTKITAELRRRLVEIGTPDAAQFSSHSFRRGAAQDMAAWGSRLHEILSAGMWRTPAFLKYLQGPELETLAAAEFAAGESDSDNDEDIVAHGPSRGGR